MQHLVGQPTYFLVARTSSTIELVLPVIKYAVAPLEVGGAKMSEKFSFNTLRFIEVEGILKLLLHLVISDKSYS